MKINLNHIPAAIRSQVAAATGILKNHLTETLNSLHLYGSALQGGLKPLSDIDLLVTVTAPLTDEVRAGLMTEILSVSAWPGTDPALRALEITVLNLSEVKPWRYPALRELQFGEWLRQRYLTLFRRPI
ncbi:TPA: nucleotidyltransferase domain-containing protein [Morganella morganii]